MHDRSGSLARNACAALPRRTGSRELEAYKALEEKSHEMTIGTSKVRQANLRFRTPACKPNELLVFAWKPMLDEGTAKRGSSMMWKEVSSLLLCSVGVVVLGAGAAHIPDKSKGSLFDASGETDGVYTKDIR